MTCCVRVADLSGTSAELGAVALVLAASWTQIPSEGVSETDMETEKKVVKNCSNMRKSFLTLILSKATKLSEKKV